eukprot:6180158-Pleurochrysis_carterae.AAC.1
MRAAVGICVLRSVYACWGRCIHTCACAHARVHEHTRVRVCSAPRGCDCLKAASASWPLWLFLELSASWISATATQSGSSGSFGTAVWMRAYSVTACIETEGQPHASFAHSSSNLASNLAPRLS